MNRLRTLEASRARLRDLCMSCSRYRGQTIECESIDCPVFFARHATERTLAVFESYRAEMWSW